MTTLTGKDLLKRSSSISASLWGKVMEKAVQGYEAKSFPSTEPVQPPVEETTLTAVSGLTGSYNGETQTVSLSWNPVHGNIQYRVYRKETSESEYTRILDSLGGTAIEDMSAMEGLTYDYYVTAFDPSTGDESEPSNLYKSWLCPRNCRLRIWNPIRETPRNRLRLMKVTTEQAMSSLLEMMAAGTETAMASQAKGMVKAQAMATEMGMVTVMVMERILLTMETEPGMAKMVKFLAMDRMAQEMDLIMATQAPEEPTPIRAIFLRYREPLWSRRIRLTDLTSPRTVHNDFESLRMIAEASLF